MNQKTKITAFMTFKIICLAVSVVLWLVGFLLFRSLANDPDFIMKAVGWILWGFCTMLAMPLEFLKSIIQGAKEGAIEGANTFKIRDHGSTFTVSNSPTGGTFKGILISGIVSLAFGPINLAIKSFGHLLTIFSCIGALKKINKAENNDN